MVAPVLPYIMREARREAEQAVRKGVRLLPCVRLSLPGGYRRLSEWGECFIGEPRGPFAGLFRTADLAPKGTG